LISAGCSGDVFLQQQMSANCVQSLVARSLRCFAKRKVKIR